MPSFHLVMTQGGQLYHTIHDDDPTVGKFGFSFPLDDVRLILNHPQLISTASITTNTSSTGRDLHLFAFNSSNGDLIHAIRLVDGSWPLQESVLAVIGNTFPNPTFAPFSVTACSTVMFAIGPATQIVGEVDILAIDKSHRLWHTSRRNDGTWGSPFADVQTQSSSNIGRIGQVACGYWPNEFFIFAVDEVGSLWRGVLDKGTGVWTSFINISNSGFVPGPGIGSLFGSMNALGQSPIACTSIANFEMHICALDSDGRLKHCLIQLESTSEWEDVKSLVPFPGDFPGVAFGDVACCSTANGDLHVTCVTAPTGQSTDGQLWYGMRRSDGVWIEFHHLQPELGISGDVLNARVSVV